MYQTPPPVPDRDRYDNAYSGQGLSSVASSVSQVMKRVYAKMTLGLLVTAVIAYLCAGSYDYMAFCATHMWFMWVLFGAQFVIVLALSGGITRMSSGMASLVFYVFATLMGLSLAPIFLAYTHASIAKTFFITAGMFGGMSVYGYFTTNDLSRMGSLLFMALIGLIIASVVNIFWANSTLDWIISFAGVLIFVGLTAWDTQTIKQWAQTALPSTYGHIATLGALSLYLDFINLFLYLLRFFGSSRD